MMEKKQTMFKNSKEASLMTLLNTPGPPRIYGNEIKVKSVSP